MRRSLVGIVASALFAATAHSAAQDLPSGGTPVIAPQAHLTTPVGGLENTGAKAQQVSATGPGFTRALRVTLAKEAKETNATQLTIPNSAPIEKGDALFAELYLRGNGAAGVARIEVLFERMVSPWTKSVTQAATASKDPTAWRRVLIPFESAETYQPNQAMLSIRLALQAQTVEIGGVRLLNYRRSRSLDDLVTLATVGNKLGTATVTLNPKVVKQTMLGLGGNFCQPRYGSTASLDAVGRYNLDRLKVAHARIGLPLNHFAPTETSIVDDGQAKASLLALQEMKRRKIPTVVSVWEPPTWLMGGPVEQSGRTLPAERYGICADLIVKYLRLGKEKYNVEPEYFSFNEPDYGVNFKFTPQEMVAFIKVAGAKFAQAGLKTKFLVGDTANGGNFYDYAVPILADGSVAKYLGPLAFHSWDALGASDLAYIRIAELGRKYKKPVWCLEAGHDAQLWQARDPWGTWDNALKTALAYERTLRLTESSLISYWTYQDNYPLVSKDGTKPYPVHDVIRQMESVFSAGSRVIGSSNTSDDLKAIATIDKTNRLSVLLVNPIGPGEVSVKGLRPRSKVRVTTNRSGSRDKVLALTADASGAVRLHLSPRSVVSIVAQSG